MHHTFHKKPALMIWVHWVSALAIVLAFALAWSRDLVDEDTLKSVILTYHQQLGLLVMSLWFVRLLIRAMSRKSTVEDMSAYLRLASVAGHFGIYIMLILMPFLGWALTNAHGHEVALFGLLSLPNLVAVNPDMADNLQEWHERMAWVLLGLVALHFLAALWHHWVRRDAVLSSMLPWVQPKVDQSVS